MKEVLRKVLFGVSLCTFLFSAVMLINRQIEASRTEKANKELAGLAESINNYETINIDNDIATEEPVVNGEKEPEIDKELEEQQRIERTRQQEERMKQQVQEKIEELKKVNKDIKGWIGINNTKVSYPIVQTKDNSFYVDHDITKKQSRYGAIFADFRNEINKSEKLQGQNIILYGHHMKDGSMFASLESFRDKTFFDENSTIKLNLFPNSYTFEVFGVYLVDENFDYRNPSLGNQEEIDDLFKRLGKKFIAKREVVLTPEDTLLTLSTCEYDYENARLVILAKLVKGEGVRRQ